jgi:thiol-disulfide isomerase/thioredoxin
MNLAFFSASWCGVCHEKAPLVEALAAEVGLPLERWDVEEDGGREEAARRRIRTVPTLALVHGERVPFRLVGSMITPENVRGLLSRFVDPGA